MSTIIETVFERTVVKNTIDAQTAPTAPPKKYTGLARNGSVPSVEGCDFWCITKSTAQNKTAAKAYEMQANIAALPLSIFTAKNLLMIPHKPFITKLSSRMRTVDFFISIFFFSYGAKKYADTKNRITPSQLHAVTGSLKIKIPDNTGRMIPPPSAQTVHRARGAF